MTLVTITQRAGEHEHYVPNAFDSAIGKRFPLRVCDTTVGDATLVGAKVAPDGHTASLTISLPISPGVVDIVDQFEARGSSSLGFEPPP